MQIPKRMLPEMPFHPKRQWLEMLVGEESCYNQIMSAGIVKIYGLINERE